jgi:NAD(P)-dependent dehydrogenase (short-subunit alcohol dehydrogenase family)
MKLVGDKVLVTGAQQGIGRAMALGFAEAGADVAVNWHNDQAKAEGVAEEVRACGRRAVLVKGDVSIVGDCRRIVAETVAELGGLDMLINNAGMFPRVPFLKMEERDYDFVLDINLKGTFFCSQAAARAMVAAGTKGAIVNLASQSVRGQTPYASHYTANELAEHGIRVNAVAPGLTDTAQPRYGNSDEEVMEMGRQIPLGRILKPSEIADMAVFLCSDRASMITGQIMHVNGGSYFG